MSSQANGFGKPNITLQDSQCKATSNATHYILETPLSGCQTTKIPSHPSPVVLYINSVSTKANIQSIISDVKSSPRVSWGVPSNTLYFVFLVLHVGFHPAGMIHFHTDFLRYFLVEIPKNTFSLELIKKTGQPPKYVSFTLNSEPQGQLQ